MTTLKRSGYCEHKFQKNGFLPDQRPQNRCIWENPKKAYAMIFQGLQCDHLTIMLASQTLNGQYGKIQKSKNLPRVPAKPFL